MSAIRNVIAAATIGIAGVATSAEATTINVAPGVRHHFCFPHNERKIVHFHHRTFLIIAHVDRHCHRHVVRVIRLGHYYAAR